jgi:hypothetical protein
MRRSEQRSYDLVQFDPGLMIRVFSEYIDFSKIMQDGFS